MSSLSDSWQQIYNTGTINSLTELHTPNITLRAFFSTALLQLTLLFRASRTYVNSQLDSALLLSMKASCPWFMASQLRLTTTSNDWLLAESEPLYDWRFTANQFVFVPRPLRPTARIFFFQLNTCSHNPYVTSSLTRGWVCHLKLLLALTSAFIFRPKSRRTHDDILLSQIWDCPNVEARSPYLYPIGTRWPSYTPRHWVPFLLPFTTCRAMVEVIPTSIHTLEDPSTMPWCINSMPTKYETLPPTVPPLLVFVFLAAEAWTGRVESYVTTNGESASLSWNKAPIWCLRPDFYYSQTVVGLLMCGAISDEKMGSPFTIASGPRQRSHSWVRVLWDTRPYFTVSDSRLPFSSPPTTHKAMVGVFDPTPTWD
jgi:hypothetical protein